MERVENKMVAEGNYEMIKQAVMEAYEVEEPSVEAQRQYLMDRIDSNETVRACLDACGFDSAEDMADWFQHADVDDLTDLLKDLEG